MTKTSATTAKGTSSATTDEEQEVDRGSRRNQTNDNPSADLVRVYLNGIGKTALLSAEDEVELAQAIEVGLYAEYKLNNAEKLTRAEKRDLKILAREGKKARSHLLEANLRLVVSLAKRYTGRGMPLLDLIQEGNLGLIRAMQEHGISVVQAGVGDRYVLEAMRARGFTLGGEQSGHLVLPDECTTGDGTLTGLSLMARMAASVSA